jgi:AraC-like DNA-binding protein
MGNPSGVGHFVSWDGGCLLVGQSRGSFPLHAHYAIQIAFCSEPGIRFRPSDAAEWTTYGAAVIPSRQPHAMDATSGPFNAVLLIEPETREGRALAERHLRGGIAAVPDDVLVGTVPALFAAWREQRSAAAVVAAARDVVRALTGGYPPRTGGLVPSVLSDARILRAVTYVRAHLDRPLTLEEVAGEACLSPSRFRHLFVEETGMALRPYILWRRFIRVWELLAAGESISAAAHAAGFADAAHLSRTSRSMFGIPPSALQLLGALPVVAPGQPLRSIPGRPTGVP